jgi:hypothetical protein
MAKPKKGLAAKVIAANANNRCITFSRSIIPNFLKIFSSQAKVTELFQEPKSFEIRMIIFLLSLHEARIKSNTYNKCLGRRLLNTRLQPCNLSFGCFL